MFPHLLHEHFGRAQPRAFGTIGGAVVVFQDLRRLCTRLFTALSHTSKNGGSIFRVLLGVLLMRMPNNVHIVAG